MKEISKTEPDTANKFTSHSFSMTDRKKASVTGVTKVDSAADTDLALTTCMGRMIITGNNLKIVKFDESDGNLAFVGNIDSIKYAQTKQPLLKRIFK